ncbi:MULTISPECIES: hypothetical protein [unclassified Acetobacterium]|jgi:uncharacterized protein YjcR|uniref:hypothetical protein n=1 Tax=unclassified Acetobacterium TaxID=2638182 RepID=UPI000DBEB7BB|nr:MULTISPECIES: hypothetical protein [unclassified Acetobacterium]AWW26909.1 hypothetical protein DOZ58_09890 [Acetobacterium sp. KB-1]MDZ5726783.1 hypothetical protein [Acetobacterium sp. K1/6]
MENYTNEELTAALWEVASTISKCEKMQGKFAQGTSQCSLLRNRIKAMDISKLLIENKLAKKEQKIIEQYTKEELIKALKPVVSVISKCEKAQGKFEEGTTHHRRLENLIKAMNISKGLLEEQLTLME